MFGMLICYGFSRHMRENQGNDIYDFNRLSVENGCMIRFQVFYVKMT